MPQPVHTQASIPAKRLKNIISVVHDVLTQRYKVFLDMFMGENSWNKEFKRNRNEPAFLLNAVKAYNMYKEGFKKRF